MNIYIDSENISHDSFNEIRNHYINSKYKILGIKVFNDWTLNTAAKWNKLCRIFSLDQIQCPKRKNSVDFAIITNIIDDMFIDDFSSKNIEKILIISSDTDYINVTNRVRKTGRDIEVFSPHFKNSMYSRQDNMFTCNEYDITQDISVGEYENPYNFYPPPKGIHTKFTEQTSSEEDETDDSDEAKRCIIRVFRWHNPNKRPFRRINLNNFIESYKNLVNIGIIENFIDNESDLYKYRDCIQIIEDNSKKYIEFIGNEQMYRKYYTCCVESVYDDIKTAFNYNRGNHTCIKILDIFNNLHLLLHKNILHTKRDHIYELMKTEESFKKYFIENISVFGKSFVLMTDSIMYKT